MGIEWRRPALTLFLFTLVTARSASAQSVRSEALDRMVEDVIALFDQADVVALGESHGSKLDSDFRIALVEHPDFASRVDVIVVEFANGARQDVLDRFVAGEDVPRAELVRVWRDTGFDAWESPVYEAFLWAVREVNASLPAGEKIRVIAGDLPIDWDVITSGRELLQYVDRGDYPTHIVDCEILTKDRKGLLIYGSLHVLHGPGDAFVTARDAKYPGRVRTLEGLRPHGDDASRFRSALQLDANPRLIMTRSTAVEGWGYYETIAPGRGGQELTLGEAVDGFLYYGEAADEVVQADSSVFEHPEYKALRARQSQLKNELRQTIEKEGWSGMRQYDDYKCDGPTRRPLP
jgi:uncharacterized iron-regulated protein